MRHHRRSVRPCLAFTAVPLVLLVWLHSLLQSEALPARASARQSFAKGNASSSASRHSGIRTIIRNGPAHAAVDVVFLSEAYTSGQEDAFYEDVARTVRLHFAAADAPFRGTLPLMNVHAIFVPSAVGRVARCTEESIDQGSTCASGTAFASFREPERLRAILPSGDTEQRAARVCEARSGCDGCDFLVLLVNDPWYGGLSSSALTIVTNSPTTSSISVSGHMVSERFPDCGARMADAYALAVAWRGRHGLGNPLQLRLASPLLARAAIPAANPDPSVRRRGRLSRSVTSWPTPSATLERSTTARAVARTSPERTLLRAAGYARPARARGARALDESGAAYLGARGFPPARQPPLLEAGFGVRQARRRSCWQSTRGDCSTLGESGTRRGSRSGAGRSGARCACRGA